MTNQKILISGVNGFVGKALAAYLHEHGYNISGLGRSQSNCDYTDFHTIDDICDLSEVNEAFTNVDYVVHLAAKAHNFDKHPQAKQEYYKTNVEGTIAITKAAIKNKVKKIIFISSVKASGERTYGSNKLDEEQTCSPEDDYGKSKLMAEKQIETLCKNLSLDYVILRPPLVYGPMIKGNFASLINLVKKLPILPLGGIKNLRSFIGLRNLCSAIHVAILSDNAKNKVYFVSDNKPVSTSDLLLCIAKIFNPNLKLISLPTFVWSILKKVPFLSSKISKLTDSLVIDPSRFIKHTDWKPTLDLLAQLRMMKE